MAMSMGGGHGRVRAGRSYRQMSEINVTPMVDVMLVLLIIFMVAAPLLTSGVEVDLPKTQAKAVSGQDEPLAISIDKAGKIYVQEREVTIETLPNLVSAITKQNKDLRIFIRGDKTVDYGRVVEVFVTLSNAGFTKVALLSEVGVDGSRAWQGPQAPAPAKKR